MSTRRGSSARFTTRGSTRARQRSAAHASARPAPRTTRSTSRAAHAPSPVRRQKLLLIVFMLMAMLLAGRLVWIQGLNASARAQEAIDQRTVERTIPALRGDITDRNGAVLATSVDRYDLWVDQRQVDQYRKNARSGRTGVDAAAYALAPVLGWSVADARTALTGERGFMYLEKGVEPQLRDAVMDLRIPGIGSDRVPERVYPATNVGGNVIGFVGADGVALAGAELSQDSVLAGQDGSTSYERGAGGQIIPTGQQTTTPAVDGRNVVLTIDQDLQWKAQDVVAKTVSEFGASAGSAVVLNARTGEILALADYPTYDPNNPGAVPAEQRGNRSISDVFEPGSTGKLFTMAAAIDTGVATPETQFTVPYEKYFDGERVKDSHPHPVKQLTLAGVLKDSSNVGTVELSEQMEPQVRYDYLRAFGLGSSTGVELPGESPGIVHPAEQWQGRTLLTTSFGQGYAVTAIQMVSAVGVFANDGVLVEPTIVRGVQQSGGSIQPLATAQSTRVISPETSQTMVRMMDTAVDDADSGAAVPGYAVAGKTGTAQVPDGTYTASFIGFAPADDPDIVIGVFVFGLTTFISGGRSAAPAFSELMSYTLQTQGIAPTGVEPRPYETEW